MAKNINAQLHMEAGNAFYDQGNYVEAFKEYQKAIEIDPINVDAYNGCGNALANLKNYEEAIEKYLRAIEIDPNSVDYTKWNDTLNKLTKDEKDKATEKFHKTIESKPDFAYAYNNWGNVLYDLEKYDDAIEKYKRGKEINPDYSEGHTYNNWGKALAKLKNYEEAIEKYLRAIEIDPSNVNVYNNCGNAFFLLKKYEDAIEKYKKAIEIGPKFAYAYYNWGRALAKLKNYDEAIEKYKSAIEIDPSDAGAYNDLGLALDKLKRYDEAIETYKETIKIDSDSVVAVYASHNIAYLLWRQGKYAASRKEWENASKNYEKEEMKKKTKESKDADYFYNSGSVQHEVFREFKMAEKIYKEGLELDPNHLGILTNLVSLYLEIMDENVNEHTWNTLFWGSEKERQSKEKQTKAYWNAREAYTKAEGILKNQQIEKAEDTDTLLQLGELHLAMEEYDKAKKCLAEALEKDKKLTTAYTNLGIVYTRNHNPDYKKAIKYFKIAYDMQAREDLTIQSNLAEAYLKAGDPNMAKIEYKKILSITPFHVESHIGLGEVYSALGVDGDEDAYDKAIYHFTEGINIAENKKDNKGSKIFVKKELAAALYSRGFARVKLYEVSKTIKDESLLRNALEDFKRCFRNDPYNHKAKRAVEKIEKGLNDLSPHRRLEVFGPLTIFFLSVIVFISSQSSFFIGKPFIVYGKSIDLKVEYYVLLTFGSIIFMMAGLYLPQILKLKFGGIELEKSPVKQITTPSTIGISK